MRQTQKTYKKVLICRLAHMCTQTHITVHKCDKMSLVLGKDRNCADNSKQLWQISSRLNCTNKIKSQHINRR